MSSHPMLVERREAFFDAVVSELGLPRPTVAVDTRNRDLQATYFREWINFLEGRQPARAIEAANPYTVGEKCPPELGNWNVIGSKHMVQGDEKSHAEDWDWHLPPDANGNEDPRIRNDIHPLAARFGIAFTVPKENWHGEFWIRDGRGGSKILERFDNIPEPEPAAPVVLPIKEQHMPYLIIVGSQPNDAWFALYASGLVRHIGGKEAGYYVDKNVDRVVEQDEPSYQRLIADSGTQWRRGQ